MRLKRKSKPGSTEIPVLDFWGGKDPENDEIRYAAVRRNGRNRYPDQNVELVIPNVEQLTRRTDNVSAGTRRSQSLGQHRQRYAMKFRVPLR